MYIDIHEKYRSSLAGFNETLIFSADFPKKFHERMPTCHLTVATDTVNHLVPEFYI